MQLLALLIEVLSIRVAGKQIKKPIDIPRPGKKAKAQRHHPNDPMHRGQQHQQEAPQRTHRVTGPEGETDPYKKGIAVLRATTRRR